jgi:ABC-2 type transport system permease protein
MADLAVRESVTIPRRELEVTAHPDTRRAWIADIVAHLDVLYMLARKDFQTRYKRASLGVVWAVAVPLLQATVMAVVFSHVVRAAQGPNYAVHVMSGVIPFTYFSSVTQLAATSIVDGSNLTEKVWFPRVLLVIVPVISNLVGLVVSLAAMLVAMPFLHGNFGPKLLLIVPALLLLTSFITALNMVLSALYVYYRDVKFLVQASLMVALYVTPVLYPPQLLGRLKDVIYCNPMSGVVMLFQEATGTTQGSILTPLAVSVGATLVLLVIGAEAQRRHDRLFVDLL